MFNKITDKIKKLKLTFKLSIQIYKKLSIIHLEKGDSITLILKVDIK